MDPRKILHQLHEIKSAVCFDKYNAMSKTYILSINENAYTRPTRIDTPIIERMPDPMQYFIIRQQ